MLSTSDQKNSLSAAHNFNIFKSFRYISLWFLHRSFWILCETGAASSIKFLVLNTFGITSPRITRNDTTTRTVIVNIFSGIARFSCYSAEMARVAFYYKGACWCAFGFCVVLQLARFLERDVVGGVDGFWLWIRFLHLIIMLIKWKGEWRGIEIQLCFSVFF